MKTKIDFENLDELAKIDNEGDKQQDVNDGALKKIRPRISLRTAVIAGGPTRVGFLPAK